LFHYLTKALTAKGASLTKLGRDIYGAEHDVLARERATVWIQSLAATIWAMRSTAKEVEDYRVHMERQMVDRAARWHAEQKGIPIAAAA
jgi:hypothetical protein